MNKNLDIKLKSFQIKRLEKWLELPPGKRRWNCPFEGLKRYADSHGICEKVFPDMNPAEYRRLCPCGAYDLVSVTKVAKALLKRNIERSLT